jgi:hypothetical protein
MNGSDDKITRGFRDAAVALVSRINGSTRNKRQLQLFGITKGG